MIHFSERIKISGDYYKWIEETEHEQGFRMKDCPITIIAFLHDKGFLNEEAIHQAYLKGDNNEH